MATQVTPGSLDTSDCGPAWSPFSRYLNPWVLPFRPPHVDVSCGFAGDGGDAIYISKYAEKKVPLPSENFFGPCGEMRTETLIDAQCNPTATLRYPGAWSICGKAAIASIAFTDTYMVGGILNGTVTVTLTDAAPALITGDAVDFLDVANAVTTANVTVTVDDPAHFHFSGALPTGVAVKSHGAPNPDWHNANPKGDFVWCFDSGNGYDGTPDVVTALQDNLNRPGGIMFVGPPGSPEIGNPKWPPATTRIQSGYPALEPGGHWYAIPIQAMPDRFFTTSQDNSMNDGDTPPGACTRRVPPPVIPLVEALLVAPYGAPFDFSLGDGNAYNKLPVAANLANFRCSGIWNNTDAFSGLSYSTWPGALPPPAAPPGTPAGTVPKASDWVTGASTADDITGLGPA